MFTIDSDARVFVYKVGFPADPEDCGALVYTVNDLRNVILQHPGEWAVRLWNQLCDVTVCRGIPMTPIHTPPGEPTAKFRNRATAVERIWNKLCELYPDAILPEDMPKQKERARKNAGTQAKRAARTTKATGAKRTKRAPDSNGNSSPWAAELAAELTKEFRAGRVFTLEQVYELESRFKHHTANKNIRPKLRQTLSVLRGNGFLKQVGRGKYERKPVQ